MCSMCVCVYVCVCMYVRHGQKIAKLFFNLRSTQFPFKLNILFKNIYIRYKICKESTQKSDNFSNWRNYRIFLYPSFFKNVRKFINIIILRNNTWKARDGKARDRKTRFNSRYNYIYIYIRANERTSERAN